MSQENTNANTEHTADDHHGDHEGHFVADWRMQISILAILLIFTVLTVGFYNFEQWVETAFQIHLPKWVNVMGAMSIATVKAILVAAFFMQLKYDKALNTFVLLFCLFCVALFLTFSMIDLNSRHWVDEWKAPSIQGGGNGSSLNVAPQNEDFSVHLGRKVNTGGQSLVHHARLNGNENKHGLLYYREHHKEAEFWKKFYKGHATHRDALDEHNYFEQLGFAHHEESSTANKSRPKYGLTPGLFSDVDPKETTHTESHDDGH